MKKEKFIHVLKNAPLLNLIGPMHSTIVTNKIKKAPILFVDGGLDFKNQLPNHLQEGPYLSIGDGDSSLSEMELDLLYPSDKDQTDLELALKLATTGLKIEAWGFSGGRIDHYLANIGEFQKHCLSKNTSCCLDDHMLFLPAGHFKFIYNGDFSLLSTLQTEVRLIGEVKFSLENPLKIDPLSGRTVSNTAFGEFEVESSQGIIFIPIDKSCSEVNLR